MRGKLSGLIILCAVVLSIISPVKIARIHAPGKDNVLITFAVCHASGPFQPSNSNMPFYPEQVCGCIAAAKLAGFYKALPSLFKFHLFAFEKEDPPRA